MRGGFVRELFDRSIFTVQTLNPRSLVPTLACPTGQSDGNDLKLKSFILEYYEEAYPDHQPRLLPGDPYEKARAKVWMDFVTTWVIPASIASCSTSLSQGRGRGY